MGIAVETPTYGLTIFKLHFGKLTLKGYTKGERVLRFEAHVHNTAELRCGRSLAKFTEIVNQLKTMLEAFLAHLHCVPICFIADDTLDRLATAGQLGNTRVGGIDLNKPRMRAAPQAVRALATSPNGFTISQFASQVRTLAGQTEQEYGPRRAAYDLKKIRAEDLVAKLGFTRRYQPLSQGLKTIAALLVLREKVVHPPLGRRRCTPARSETQKTGVASINTMKPFASTCEAYSRNWESPRRQFFVDANRPRA